MGDQTREIERSCRRAKRVLSEWRKRRGGRGRSFPVEVWEEAAKAAEKHGVGRVSKELGLNAARLKRYVEKNGARPSKRRVSGDGSGATFVELGPSLLGPTSAIEVRSAGGSSIRIEFSGSISEEVSGLAVRLWGEAQ